MPPRRRRRAATAGLWRWPLETTPEPHQEMAGTTMQSGSSTAVSTRKLAHLPLIICPKCFGHTVFEREVKTNEHGNRGRIFFTCPARKRDGSGSCDFWEWEEGYIKELEKLRGKMDLQENERPRESEVEVQAGKKRNGERDISADISALVRIGKEIVFLLKCLVLCWLVVLICLVYHVLMSME